MKRISKTSAILGLFPEWVFVVGLYLVTHLPALTLLPVFADEAIYIRWAQLIQDDLGRYAFFSMADGKPPLFMWLLSLALRFFVDPLMAGRFLSVIIGLTTVFVLRRVVKEFTEVAVARWTVTLAVIVLPFWFFYHRMALMDSLLALLLSVSFLFAIRLSKASEASFKTKLLNLVGLGLSFGASLMTKTPALFAIPIIALTPIYFWHKERRGFGSLPRYLIWVGLGGFFGCLLFLSLRISPLFGSLFSRSTDFTFTFKDLISGEWKYVLGNSLRRNLGWIVFYLTPGFSIITFIGLFFRKSRKDVIFLLCCTALFFAPLTLFGRVLWPRYFLPTTIFMMVAASIGLAECIKHKVFGIFCAFLIFLTTVASLYFMFAAYLKPERIPFVSEDSSQYLYEWSAGYGNTEVQQFIVERQKHMPPDGSRRIIVLTEGSFGTLPDGLLMYFHSGDHAKTMEVHGIGVGVPRIPEEYIVAAKSNEVYYVLNSHRFGIVDQSQLKKIFEVERPASPKYPSPSLLLYEVLPR